MLIVANRIYVSPGHEEDFEARFRGRAHLVDQSEGFIRNEVLKPITQGAPYVVMTHWRDRASFEAWTKSTAFGEAHRNLPPPDMFSRPNEFEMYETLESP
jgi:heme-degrading monooxygenase HmoA